MRGLCQEVTSEQGLEPRVGPSWQSPEKVAGTGSRWWTWQCSQTPGLGETSRGLWPLPSSEQELESGWAWLVVGGRDGKQLSCRVGGQDEGNVAGALLAGGSFLSSEAWGAWLGACSPWELLRKPL